MAETDCPELSEYLADDIRDQADALVERWIEWILEEASIRPSHMLPRDAIRDHIPDVAGGVSEAIRGPVEAVGVLLHAIRTHGRLRHDQGVDIEELLKEYNGLGRFLRERADEALTRYPGGADPVEVGRINSRLTEALSAVTDLTVAIYRKTEVEQKRELHRQIENYVQTVTRELKQPLNAMTAGAGMLEAGGEGLTEERRERCIAIIRHGIERSVDLLDEIRTLVLVEGAQQEGWQPLEAALNLVLREMSEQARRHDVQIRIEQPLPRINVDPTRVEIALVNLISNAIKYADPAKSERWVGIEVERAEAEDGNRWEVRVTDNGLGIADTVKTQVFERHFRARPQVGEGTGLGLAITRHLIEQAGGRIWFESTEGEGSTFHFVVPAYLNDTAIDVEPTVDAIR